METENQNLVVSQLSPLNRVTPLSKYLAMVLFVALPFIGGWIGYTYAPEKVVEVERVIEVEKNSLSDIQESKPDESLTIQPGNTDSWYRVQTQYRVVDMYGSPSPKVVIEDINVPFRETLVDWVEPEDRDKYVLEKLVESEDGNTILFKSSIPHSSACCGIVKLDLNTLSLSKHGGYLPMYGEFPSPGNRFVPSVSSNEVSIVDIIANTKIKTAQVSGNETLASSHCGYAGDTYDLEWVSDLVLEYGVYDKASLEEDICNGKLIEKRLLSVD